MDYYSFSSLLLVALVMVVIAALALGIYALARRKQRREELRAAFGPEYDYALERFGGERRAERELAHRMKRVRKFHIQPLSARDHERFSVAWSQTQARFVDDPNRAIADADRLVKEVMGVRGYPMADFDQRVADLSVDHANVVQHYRAARALAQSTEEGRATTEDLRQAMIHYRALFADLLETQSAEQPGWVQEVRA